MFAVVFEVHPRAGRKDAYLALARQLKPMLDEVDGFIDNERFESRRREGWVLSLSTWRDEKAVVRWRSQGEHHGVQGEGRSAIFADYHLRVCEVTTDDRPPTGLQVVQQRFDETEVGQAKALAITEISPRGGASFPPTDEFLAGLGFEAKSAGLLGHDLFESIFNPGKLLLLTSWNSAAEAGRWVPRSFDGVAGLRHRRLRSVRDYGMFERREAPQYFAPAQPPAG